MYAILMHYEYDIKIKIETKSIFISYEVKYYISFLILTIIPNLYT